MTEKLEHLVDQADSEIKSRKQKKGTDRSQRSLQLFDRSNRLVCLYFIHVFESETLVGLVSPPAENKIARDLEHILSRATDSLESYERLNGTLPPLLPNPAIRGLVGYDRKSDFDYALTATIGSVTMVKTASSHLPYRQVTE